MFRALCAHHQEVKIVLYSIWYRHSCRWPSRAQVESGLRCTVSKTSKSGRLYYCAPPSSAEVENQWNCVSTCLCSIHRDTTSCSNVQGLTGIFVLFCNRGRNSLETICLLLAYKLKYPNNFFLLRGNHECASINR